MAQITSGSLTIVDVTDGAPGLNNTTVFLYRRAVSAPDKPTGNLTYTFSTASITGALEGWVQSISELTGSDPIWMIAAVASSNGETDVIESSEWAGPIKMAQNGQDGLPGAPGTNGLNQATIFIYKRDDSATAPSSTTYTFATGGFTVPSGWSKTIPTEPKGKPCWVTSAIAIGAEATAELNWVTPSVLVEDGSDGISPTVTAIENGVKIVDADGNETFITNGADGTSYYTFVRYSKNANGSGYVATPTSETIYIGVYTGTKSSPPAYNDSGWTWSKYVGADGQPGTPGSQGPQGVSVASTRELYYLKTNSTDPAQIINANQIHTDDDVNQWTSVVPTYIGSGKYYTCIETTLSNGNVVWSAPVENKGLTDANVNAANAIEIARGVKQHFFWVATDKSENIPAGAYVAEESEESFYSNPTKGNILTRSDGIWIRNGVDKLATLQGSGLTFLVPTGTYKGQKSVSLNGSGLTFYNIGSSNSAAATLASDGLQITNGSIVLGTTSGTDAGNVTLSNKNFTRSINETSHNDLRFAIGSKFGVASDGTLYSAGLDSVASSVQSLDGRVSTAETNITQNAANITLTAEKSVYMSKPNLSPFFQSTPFNSNGGYWLNITGSFTPLEDGWAHFSRDNTSGTAVSNNYARMVSCPSVFDGNTYTFLVEIRNLVSNAASNNLYTQQAEQTQFWGSTEGFSIANSTMVDGKYYKSATALGVSQHQTDGTRLIYLNWQVPIGAKIEADIRISLYEGEYSGEYKPYVGSQMYASQAELKIANDNISSKVSTTDYNGETIASLINQTADTVKIEAEHIKIDGTATFNAIKSSADAAYDAKGAASTAESNAKSYADTAVADKADKSNAVARTQRIYYRKTASGAPSANTTWLATSGTGYGNWSLKVPQMTSGTTKYPYLYTAVQTQTVAQMAAGNACSCSAVLLDDTTTVIDGGTIITGSVNANAVNASSGTFDTANIPDLNANKIRAGTLSSDRIKASVITAVNNSTETSGGSELKISADKVNIEGAAVFNNYSTTAEMNDAIGGAVDGIEVGGRNLLVGTGTSISKATTATSSYVTQILYDTPNLAMLSALGFAVNDEVTLSFDWKITSATTYGNARIEWYGKTSSSENYYIAPLINPFATFSASNTSGHVTKTVKLTSATVQAKRLVLRIDNSNLTLTISNLKLEKGNKATDWSPAPEDVTEYTDNAVNSIEIGGRNLAVNTSGENWYSVAIADGTNKVINLFGATDEYCIDIPSIAGVKVGDLIQVSFDIKFGSNWTATGTGTKQSYVQGSCNRPISWKSVAYSSGGGNQQSNLEAIMASSSKEGHIHTWFVVTSDMLDGTYTGLTMSNVRFDYYSGTVSVRHVMVEKATKPSGWSPAPEDVQAEIDAKRSVWTIMATGVDEAYTYAQLLGWSSSANILTWNVTSSAGVKVGDTVRVGVKVSNMNNAVAYLLIEVTSVPSSTQIKGYAKGLDTTIIDGGNILTNSITANQIATNAVKAEELDTDNINNSGLLSTGALTVGAKNEVLNSNIEVGGRNLLLDTDAPSVTKVHASSNRYWSSGTTTGYTATFEEMSGLPAYGAKYAARLKQTANFGTVHMLCWYSNQGACVNLVRGEQYTMSVWCKKVSGTDVKIRFQYGATNFRSANYSLEDDSEWHRYSHTFTAADVDGLYYDNSSQTRIYIGGLYASAASEALFCGFKLEKGNKPTDWEPAPEDVQAEIDDASTKATNYINHIDNNGIRIHPASTENDSVVINASGMEVFKGGTSVAKYGDSARIGKESGSHLTLAPDSMSMSDGVKDVFNLLQKTMYIYWTRNYKGRQFANSTDRYVDSWETNTTISTWDSIAVNYKLNNTSKTKKITSISNGVLVNDEIYVHFNYSGTIMTLTYGRGNSAASSDIIKLESAVVYYVTDEHLSQLHTGTYPNTTVSGALRIGNGTSDSNRRNLMLVDWSGTGKFKGDILAFCGADSSGGMSLTKAEENIDAFKYEAANGHVYINAYRVGRIVSLLCSVSKTASTASGADLYRLDLTNAHLPKPLGTNTSGTGIYSNNMIIGNVYYNKTVTPNRYEFICRNGGSTAASTVSVGFTITYICQMDEVSGEIKYMDD